MSYSWRWIVYASRFGCDSQLFAIDVVFQLLSASMIDERHVDYTYVGVVDESGSRGGRRSARLAALLVVLGAQIDGPLQSEFWNEDLKGVLADREDIGVLVLDSLFEEKVRMEGHRGALSVLGHLVPIIEVVAGRLNVPAVQQLRVGHIGSHGHGHQTVNQKIGIS